MNPSIIAALVRHILTAVGGGFVVRYGIDGATFDAIVGGASATAGLVWSIMDKRKRDSGNPSF
jgi:hypothetical protein